MTRIGDWLARLIERETARANRRRRAREESARRRAQVESLWWYP